MTDGTPRRAQVVQGDGFAGWTMVHRAARPVDGAQVGDPHWHVHTTFANLTGIGKGKYGTVAAGGRDLMRHMRPADALYHAMVRHELTEQFGVQFARSERTDQWEIVGIPDEAIVQFSKRSEEVPTMLRSLGFDAVTVSAAQARMANLRSRPLAPTLGRPSDLVW